MVDQVGAVATALDADKDEGIGRRLRLRRIVRGRSLQQVAEAAGISIGLLSQIERGLTTPSLRSLRQICAALDMPVGWLFDVPKGEHDDVVVRADARRTLDIGPKGMRKELLSPDAVPGIQMMRIVVRPGGSTGEVALRSETGSKCGTILTGTLGLEVGGVEYRLEAGDSFAFPSTDPHRYWCVGSESVDMIWVTSPAVY